MNNHWGNRVDGRQLLRNVKQQLTRFESTIRERNTKVAIIHFEDPGEGAPESLRTRIKAADVSTRTKLRTFRDLGIEPIDISKRWDISIEDFTQTISALNEDSSVAGIIVQHPMDISIRRNLRQIAPEKDLDTLTIREENPLQTPATSDAILRTTAAFTDSDNLSIAVVGAQGFVGSGVVSQLREQGASILELDARNPDFTPDDLLQVADADIVISAVGQSEILDERHLRPHHRVIIDCGFSPVGNEIYGDVKKSTYDIPQNITPVPGGIGPTEMAVLAERLIRKEVAPELESWSFQKQSYLSREEVQDFQSQWAQDIYPTARKLLDIFPESIQREPTGQRLEGNNYTLHIDGESNQLSLFSTQDSRGVIAKYNREGRTLQNNLSNRDAKAWSSIEQALTQERSQKRDSLDIEL